MQRRAGVEQAAAAVGRHMRSRISPDLAEFLASRVFAVIAGSDPQDRSWASLITGEAGFARVIDERRLLLSGELAEHDPLAAAFDPPGGLLGLLALEPDTRSRVRLNGVGARTPDGLLIEVSEVFGNCRRFIQRRVPGRVPAAGPSWRPRWQTSARLDDYQAVLIRRADTFFIATSHPERGADASHRGGTPGFVEVSANADSVTFPDYPGNKMFQTLGNLAVDPRVGLLFVDWQAGSVVQLTGRARVVWDEDKVAAWPGAERLVRIQIDAVSERQQVLPVSWDLIEASRANPPVRPS